LSTVINVTTDTQHSMHRSTALLAGVRVRVRVRVRVGDRPLSTLIRVTTNTQHSMHRSTALLAVSQCQLRAGDTGPSKSWLGPQI